MNISRLYFFVLLLFAFALLNASAPEKFQKDLSEGDEIVEIPCQGADYRSDKNYFRATGTSGHANPRVAKRMARLAANANLAANIDITVRVVSDRYLKENHQGNKGEVTEKFESLTRSVTNQELSNVTEICSESEYQDGKHIFYIAIETPKDGVLEHVEQAISGDESAGIDYEKEKFGEIFDEEMEKLENVSDSIDTE